MASINNLNKRSASAAELDDKEHDAKRNHRQRVLAYMKEDQETGHWVRMTEDQWDALVAARKAGGDVEVEFRGLPVMVDISKSSDIPYVASETHAPRRYKRLQELLDKIGMPVRSLASFTVAFSEDDD
jgi:hypothetical protein